MPHRSSSGGRLVAVVTSDDKALPSPLWSAPGSGALPSLSTCPFSPLCMSFFLPLGGGGAVAAGGCGLVRDEEQAGGDRSTRAAAPLHLGRSGSSGPGANAEMGGPD
jgi:hypothetical protein